MTVGSLLLAMSAGCGSSYPRCVEVGGRVTYRGQPVKDGWVSFTPVNQTSGEKLMRPASGNLQADGSYIMKTFREGEGVLPGEYAVTIAAFDYSGEVDRKTTADNRPDRRLPSTVPLKYASPVTSGLKATISADATRQLTFDFNLSD